MENREPWLVCQNGRKGKKRILLVQDEQYYYIIDAYNGFSYKKRDYLAAHEVTEKLLQTLDVRYERIAKNGIRGFSIGGYCAGDAVYLYPNSGSRLKFILMVNHQKTHVDCFFEGMKRFTAPSDKKQNNWNREYWRRECRDQTEFEKCKYIPWLLSGVSLLFSIGYAATDAWMWYTGCLVCLVLPFILTIGYPAYFTLMIAGKGKRSDAWELGWPIYIHLFVEFISSRLNWISNAMYILVAIGSGLTIVVILSICSEEFSRKKSALWMAFLVAAICGCFTVGNINEAFNFSNPQYYVLEVESKRVTTGKSKSYKCTVILPDGREVELSISRSYFDELEIGDLVQVEHNTGVLGIEYANIILDE